MHLNNFLSAYLPDTAYSGVLLFGGMLAQAQLADEIGYASVTILQEAPKKVCAALRKFLPQ